MKSTPRRPHNKRSGVLNEHHRIWKRFSFGGEDGLHRALLEIEHDERPLVPGSRRVGDAVAIR
jgi:hypothetical protein